MGNSKGLAKNRRGTAELQLEFKKKAVRSHCPVIYSSYHRCAHAAQTNKVCCSSRDVSIFLSRN